MKWNNEFLRYEYPLTSESLVFDVGGYKGEFARNMADKFHCTIHVFEPIPEFCDNLMKNIGPNTKVIRAGLSDTTRIANINVCAEGTTLYGMVGCTIPIQLYSLRDYMLMEGVSEVDLIKINIEGEEYPLLYHMIKTGIVHLFNYIQVQFHKEIPDAEKLRSLISIELNKTHKRDWCFDWIWESWSLR